MRAGVLLLAAIWLLVLGCAAPADPAAARRAEFAAWVRQQDPDARYYTEARVPADDALELTIRPTLVQADIDPMLRGLATEMARRFPGRPLSVTAAYASGDRVADARFDPASGTIAVRTLQR